MQNSDKRIYLAGSIEGLTWKEASGWRIKAADALRDMRMDVYDPCDHVPFEVRNEIITVERVRQAGGFRGKEIVTQDLFHLQGCNIFLVKLGGFNTASKGTMIELGIAWARGLIIIGFGDQSNHPFISELASVVYDTLDEALDFIINI